MTMRENGLLRETLARDRFGEEKVRRWWMGEVGAFTFMTRLVVRLLAGLIAILSGPEGQSSLSKNSRAAECTTYLQREQYFNLRDAPPFRPQLEHISISVFFACFA